VTDRLSGARTRSRTLVSGEPGALGYRRLVSGPGEDLATRVDLGGAPPAGSRPLRSLLAFVHLSDLHITDVQSPARAEFLDRLGDEDCPLAAALGRVGTYRAQEALTYQVLEAMAGAVRAALPDGGPATGAPFAFAVSTGDNVDNCQRNELDAYLALLEGGSEVRPDSGDPLRYEGVGGWQLYDERYWHPDGTPPGAEDDLPRRQRGFPTVPGLLDACRQPFRAGGLGLPWYAVYGNHDSLLVGTQPPDTGLHELAVGAEKPVRLADDLDPLELLAGTETAPSPMAWGMLHAEVRKVTPDASRRFVDVAEWIGAHLDSSGQPSGHGFDAAGAAHGRAYYALDAGIVRLVVLDSVNREGGWQGSLDAEQFAWLEAELVAGHRRHLDASSKVVEPGNDDRLFVLFAHHSIETMINPYSARGVTRLLGDDLVGLLGRFGNVVAFVNGHTHEHAVRSVPTPGGGGFWQITTGSHIDWPQQSRLIELALDEDSGEVLVVTEMLDHVGLVDPRHAPLSDPATMAGWSRELALNAWQGRSRPEEPWGRGEATDRNCLLVWPAPFAVRDALAACSRRAGPPEGPR
jgi:metallophosphoesterase (TIGR03767 family)